MKYNIGDKVEIKNGLIVIIDGIVSEDPATYFYGYPVKCCLPENDILRKI
ncbi:MAG: hypothetical protein HFJ60_09050 [Clostridia bacterium]|jgi:hypothetical protein|nr:hypothetical protein [Clostridia bacterium]